MFIHDWAYSIKRTLYSPLKVAAFCTIILFLALILNGSLWKLWGLHRDYQRVLLAIEQTSNESNNLDLQLKQAKDPSFIERQAKDKYDLAGDQDLVFVFSDN